jgi:hypothetical protein
MLRRLRLGLPLRELHLPRLLTARSQTLGGMHSELTNSRTTLLLKFVARFVQCRN